MKNVPALILCVIVACTSLRCTDDMVGPDTPTNTGSILPLRSGNAWVFDRISIDTTGDPVTIPNGLTLSISSDTTVHGKHYVVFGGTLLCREDSVGIWASDGTTELLWKKYPAVKGEQYGSASLPIVVANTDTLISVPLGTFRCVEYRYGSTQEFLAPGVGFVKIMMIMGDAPVSLELRSCTLR